MCRVSLAEQQMLTLPEHWYHSRFFVFFGGSSYCFSFLCGVLFFLSSKSYLMGNIYIRLALLHMQIAFVSSVVVQDMFLIWILTYLNCPTADALVLLLVFMKFVFCKSCCSWFGWFKWQVSVVRDLWNYNITRRYVKTTNIKPVVTLTSRLYRVKLIYWYLKNNSVLICVKTYIP